jgi:hypothetical protein
MNDPKGEIDPRSTYAIREQAMDMAITARHKDYDASLIEMAIEIEGFLLGDNSRLAPTPEQPEQPSAETMADEIEGTPAPLPVEPLQQAAQDGPYATPEQLTDLGLPNTFQMEGGKVISAHISNGSAETE